eukprot:Gregarina_sp_Pseudo_9__4732@NODE_4939_length_350_cov_3_038585_g4601_i0_p1_GENE_NODE_4939_length_350_cov_3_038585_g4601_i0NODE_4939_length_350_cov_3_038585_g4601_i0_p1_ORF_typecomplete_len102_score4_65N_Asn_amidohyd/PF14736_6/0_0065_NODE_4939_length_350_cov_3_038585_g4601_i015320
MRIAPRPNQERLMDRTKNKNDCRIMLKYCADTDPNLALRIVQETTPSPQLEDPEFWKEFRDDFDFMSRVVPWGVVMSSDSPVEFVGRVYRALGRICYRRLA